MNYKTYAEARIANPESEIVTTGKNWGYEKETIGTFGVRVFDGDDDGAHIISDEAWVICNPADYCSSIKEFLEGGNVFSIGDLFLGISGDVTEVEAIYPQTNKCEDSDDKRYILSAAALNGGCKIPAKADKWTIYNNTMPLCELTDEQAAMLFNAWRRGETRETKAHCGFVEVRSAYESWFESVIYRIKSKSERELFIEAAISHGVKPETQSPKQIFGELFDSGKFKYIDNTKHFGENI